MSAHRAAGLTPVSVVVTLPLPPSVNNQYLTVGRRRVLSKPAQVFNQDVAKLVEQSRRDGLVSAADEAAIRVSLLGIYLTFYFETPLRRDLDGGLKIALDALSRALGFDDRTVVDLHLTKRIDPIRPRLEVELETVPTWEFDRPYVYLGEKDAPDAGDHDHGP